MTRPSSTVTPAQHDGWHLVIPVKDVSLGKSRLVRSLGLGQNPPARHAINRALADDTLAAASTAIGASRVVLVTSDRNLGMAWSARGVRLVDDPERGLNAAIARGLGVVPAAQQVAALLGDLPALTPADLLAALEAAESHAQSFVPDAAGSGTVLRCSVRQPDHFTPRFGADSAARHASDGAHRLALDLPRLRTDVDDLPSLAAACRLGLGPATLAALEQSDLLGWDPCRPRFTLSTPFPAPGA